MTLVHIYPSEMAQNFWTAIWAFNGCFVVTAAVSLVTNPRADKDLIGLVYSLTPKPTAQGKSWYSRPALLGCCVLLGALALNLFFW
jgi:SSS family solute:Na+ symporter